MALALAAAAHAVAIGQINPRKGDISTPFRHDLALIPEPQDTRWMSLEGPKERAYASQNTPSLAPQDHPKDPPEHQGVLRGAPRGNIHALRSSLRARLHQPGPRNVSRWPQKGVSGAHTVHTVTPPRAAPNPSPSPPTVQPPSGNDPIHLPPENPTQPPPPQRTAQALPSSLHMAPAPAESSSAHPPGTPEGLSDVNRTHPKYLRWFTQVQRSVEQQLTFPRARRLALDQGAGLHTFVLDRRGRLQGAPVLLRTSGFADFDTTARQAIEQAAPFPPIPKGIGAQQTVRLEMIVEHANPMM